MTDSGKLWWLEYHKIDWNKRKTSYTYGHRVLYISCTKLHQNRFVQFSENIGLLNSAIYLMGPFEFAHKDSKTPLNFIVLNPTWIRVCEICQAGSIMTPTIGRKNLKI